MQFTLLYNQVMLEAQCVSLFYHFIKLVFLETVAKLLS